VGTPSVSAVLAAHNEKATVGSVVRGCIEALPTGSEVIVVDDGSSDDTGTVARRAGARVLRLAANRGKGYAMRVGLRQARFDVLALLDADGQDDPADLPPLLAERPGDGGLVIGSRFLGTFEPHAITHVNAAGNRALTSVINRLYGTRLTDTQAGMRVLDRATLARCQLRAEGFDFETDLLLGVLDAGLPVIEVGVRRRARAAGRSHLSSVPDGMRILGRILRRRFGR
jgi:glycosyltransferase involved in cell wall biosynthesis